MKTFHVDEPREIGKKKLRISSRDKRELKDELTERIVKKRMSERFNITTEQAKQVLGNICIH